MKPDDIVTRLRESLEMIHPDPQDVRDAINEIERLRGYQAGYAGLVEDNSTYEDEVERLKGLLDPIIKAFTVQGPVPAYHEHIKRGLKKEWPVLYRALEQASKQY
jgi:hypothetical protein